MLTSLAYIFIIGLGMAAICEKLKLPRIIGMLFAGILLGPYAFHLLDDSILAISSDLREMALIIILLKAGLSLDLNDLKKVGRPALMMSFVPATFEIIGYILIAPLLLDISILEAALIGAILAAVSPAVVIPRMVKLMDEGYGTNKSIPQMIMSGASCDDIFVIVLFSSFLSMNQGQGVNLASFLDIPVSIIFGILIGIVVGLASSFFFEQQHQHGHTIANSFKVIIILALSFALLALEDIITMSGLLAIVAMAATIKVKMVNEVSQGLSAKFGKLWLAAEVLLFVLVGAAVDIRYTLSAGFSAVLVILLALIFRAIGVALCMIKTPLNKQERLFCVLAYLPKATVQAAIGSVPLAAGLACGQLALSIAVLGILITAPLGAIAIDVSYKRLLQNCTNNRAV
ncbi:MAG: cation:proton antiporter [Erysipelotrichaceae bacterium]|nr:cation:proton antiporter [Erysipelotrichaceae bacterium]MDY5251536.1 cation:proton antiporter [Erysipelotrichaceae bacterium]